MRTRPFWYLERGAAASIDIDAAVAAHHDEFAFPM